MGKIKQIVIFAKSTLGEALELANNAEGEHGVAEIRIMKGLEPAELPVAWIVLPKKSLDKL